jgi:hypothetical protein
MIHQLTAQNSSASLAQMHNLPGIGVIAQVGVNQIPIIPKEVAWQGQGQ